MFYFIDFSSLYRVYSSYVKGADTNPDSKHLLKLRVSLMSSHRRADEMHVSSFYIRMVVLNTNQ